jgi:uncharacterized membrane protein YkgB
VLKDVLMLAGAVVMIADSARQLLEERAMPAATRLQGV